MVVWCNIFIFFLIRLFNNRLLCYAAFVVSLLLIHQEIFDSDKLYLSDLDGSRKLLFDVSLAWLNAKCLSLTIDSFTHSSFNTFNSVINQLTYCLYFPSVFNGPIYNYFNFVEVCLFNIFIIIIIVIIILSIITNYCFYFLHRILKIAQNGAGVHF